MYVTRSIRICPTEEQRRHLTSVGRAYRWTYNWALDKLYVEPGLSRYDLHKMFTRFKADNSDIRDMVEVLYHRRAMNAAHMAHARATEDGGRARYMSRRRGTPTIGADAKPRLTGANTVSIPGIKNMRTSSLRFVRNTKSFTITADYRMHITCDIDTAAKKTPADRPLVVGIDVGAAKPYAVSTVNARRGRITGRSWYAMPGGLEVLAERIRHLSSKLAKMSRGSGRRKRAETLRRRLCRKLANIRRHATRMLVNRLAGQHVSEIRVERMRTGAMTRRGGRRKRAMNRGFRSTDLSHFKTFLARRCGERGITYAEADPRYTSQTCAACGHTSGDNRASQSLFECKGCGHTDNADANASLNIALSDIKFTRSSHMWGRAVNGVLGRSLVRRELDAAGRHFIAHPPVDTQARWRSNSVPAETRTRDRRHTKRRPSGGKTAAVLCT